LKQFDYIVVGGGSAGCVLANRLSEDSNISVCLLEAGPKESLKGRVPLFLHALMGDKQRNWDRYTVPQPALNNRPIYQPCGKGLGGGSAINSMIYIRGFKPDYDNWAQLGNDGWSYDDVLPYFKKSESYQHGASDFHGVDGELSVSDLRHIEKPTQILLDAAQECGYPIANDFNQPVTEGFAPYQVTQVNGERCSSSRAFLNPVKNRDNLTVITGTQVYKVLFEGNKTVGVAYIENGEKKQILCQQEVILSAGAIGSAQLLLLSGIGPAEQLKQHNIEMIHELPGVGENFQDHLDVGISFHAKSGFGLGISPQFMPRAIKGVWQYLFGGRKGVLASNVVEGGGFVRSEPDLIAPDIQFHFLSGNASNNGRSLNYGHSFTMTACVLRPKSRGTLKLQSADVKQSPIIDPKFLSKEGDLDTLVHGVKVVKKILESKSFSPYRKKQRSPEMQLNTDTEIIEHIKQNSGTVYHPVGTCKMGPDNDPMAVVNPQLCVRGVTGLRVADASIMPNIVSGNTNAPSIMVGEKASDLVKAEQQ